MKTVGRLQRHGFRRRRGGARRRRRDRVSGSGRCGRPRAALAVLVVLWTLALLLRRRFPFAAPVLGLLFLYVTVALRIETPSRAWTRARSRCCSRSGRPALRTEARQAAAAVAIGCATVAVLIERDLQIESSDGIEEVLLGVASPWRRLCWSGGRGGRRRWRSGRSGSSASARSASARRSPRSGGGSRAICTTWSPTAWG